jgi:PLP dependent protein
MDMAETILDRYLQINNKITQSCKQAGRARNDVNLIVVTKGQSAESIIEVMNAGAIMLGENYPEETARKIEEIRPKYSPNWHMIGHLQSRKIKLMFPEFSCIHSVDSLELAQKINRFYEEKGSIIDVLLEVNIAGEESKFGFDASDEKKRDELLKSLESILALSNIHPIGLMTMPPYAKMAAQNEECYNLCGQYCEKIRQKLGLKDFTQLSMGTSADFETAVRCGATYVRVGEAIMGRRNYPAI